MIENEFFKKKRLEIKREWNDNLMKLINMDSFKDVLNIMGLNGYIIKQMKPEHLHESINIASYAFSSQGNGTVFPLTQTNINDAFWVQKSYHDITIKNGLNLVILNHKNQVCCGAFLFDMFDDNEYDIMNHKYNIKTPYSYTLIKSILNKSKIYNEYMNNKHKYTYGDFIRNGFVYTAPNIITKGLGTLATSLVTILAISVGYKKQLITVQHIMTINNAKKLLKYGNKNELECEFIRFDDITMMDGNHVNIFFNRLKNERKYSNDIINNIKRNCIYGITITHLNELIKHVNGSLFDKAIHEWNKRKQFIFKKYAKL